MYMCPFCYEIFKKESTCHHEKTMKGMRITFKVGEEGYNSQFLQNDLICYESYRSSGDMSRRAVVRMQKNILKAMKIFKHKGI